MGLFLVRVLYAYLILTVLLDIVSYLSEPHWTVNLDTLAILKIIKANFGSLRGSWFK